MNTHICSVYSQQRLWFAVQWRQTQKIGDKGCSGEADQKEQNKVCVEAADPGIILLLLVTALVEAMGSAASVRCGGSNTGSGERSLGSVSPARVSHNRARTRCGGAGPAKATSLLRFGF